MGSASCEWFVCVLWVLNGRYNSNSESWWPSCRHQYTAILHQVAKHYSLLIFHFIYLSFPQEDTSKIVSSSTERPKGASSIRSIKLKAPHEDKKDQMDKIPLMILIDTSMRFGLFHTTQYAMALETRVSILRAALAFCTGETKCVLDETEASHYTAAWHLKLISRAISMSLHEGRGVATKDSDG